MTSKAGLTKSLGALLLAAGVALAGDYSTWARFRNVTVNTSAMTLGGAVKNIPVLVRFNPTTHKDMVDSSTQILANGADIRVTKGDGTTDVPFEIETATTGPTGGIALWIKADSVAQNSATAATFRVYWGKAGATTLSNSKAVFDTANGFVAVWHMNDLTDATGNGYTLSGATQPTAALDSNAVIGGAKTFVAASTHFYSIAGKGNTTADSTTLSLNTVNGPYTVTAWAKPTSCPSARMIVIGKYDGAGSTGTRQWALQTKSTAANWGMSNDPNLPAFQTATSGNEYVADAAGTCVVNSTVYMAGSYSQPGTPVVAATDSTGAGRLRFQVNNGAIVTSGTGAVATGTQIGQSALPFIGKGSGTAPRYMDGTLDEITVSKVQRDTNWVEVSYETQKRTVTAVTVSATATQSGPYGAWTGHRTIKLNTSATGANVANTVTNFPVLIRLGAGEASIIAASKAGGADIRFSKADDATALPYEIETWNAGTNSAAIWVKVDTILGNNSTQTIRMHYGNTAATSASSGSAVFDTANGFRAVWHMNGTTNENDATINGNTMTANGTPTSVLGAVGTARMLDSAAATRQYFTAANSAASASLNIGSNSPLTLSAWVFSKGFSAATNGYGNSIVNKGDRQYCMQSYGNPAATAARWEATVYSPNNGWREIIADKVTPDTLTWHHLVGTWSGGANGTNAIGRFYVDGVKGRDTTLAIGTPAQTQTFDVFIGVNPNGSGSGSAAPNTISTAPRPWHGMLDEISISAAERDSNWVRLAFANQKQINTLADIGIGVTAPSAPASVTAVAGIAQAVVSWQAPASDGGVAITGYKAVAVSDTTKACTTTGGLTCTITGLTNGTAYTFTVTATNSVGRSVSSAASSAVTPNATVPGAPTAVGGTAGAAGSGTVTVAWTAPANNGGSAITGYKAMAVSDTTKNCTTTGAVTCNITGLTNGTAYTFVVRAVNAIGSSATSTASSAVTVPVSIGPGSLLISVGSFTKAYTFQLPEAAATTTDNLTMSISDASGKTVWERTINPAESKARSISWNGLTSTGSKVSAGMYIVRVRFAGSHDIIQSGVKLQHD